MMFIIFLVVRSHKDNNIPLPSGNQTYQVRESPIEFKILLARNLHSVLGFSGRTFVEHWRVHSYPIVIPLPNHDLVGGLVAIFYFPIYWE